MGLSFILRSPIEYLISGEKIKYFILFAKPIPKSIAISGLLLNSELGFDLSLIGILKLGGNANEIDHPRPI